MAVAKTGIEWTDSSWNPTTGCTKVSPGCDNCYAETLALTKLREPYSRRLPVVDTEVNRADPFAVRLWPERLTQPERWREPRMIFVNSMSDLFHVHVPSEYVRQVFEVMLRVDRHIYQVLTKRPARMADFVRRNRDLFPDEVVPAHIWMGASVESQEYAAYRVRHLTTVRAITRFLSCEPLLGPLDLGLESLDPVSEGIHWVIVGGESGVGARRMDLDWVRSIRDQCRYADVAFFFKQVGGRTPKAGGRELDGRTWDEFPHTHTRVPKATERSEG